MNEQLAQVVEGLEFAGLEDRKMESRLGRQFCMYKMLEKGNSKENIAD